MHTEIKPIQSDKFTLSKCKQVESKAKMNIEEWLHERGIQTPLENITELYLVRSGLSHIPDDIDRMHNLTQLVLRKNRFKRLPDSICALSNLEVLDVRDNQLTELPEKMVI